MTPERSRREARRQLQRMLHDLDNTIGSAFNGTVLTPDTYREVHAWMTERSPMEITLDGNAYVRDRIEITFDENTAVLHTNVHYSPKDPTVVVHSFTIDADDGIEEPPAMPEGAWESYSA